MVDNFKLEDMIQYYGREFLAEKLSRPRSSSVLTDAHWAAPRPETEADKLIILNKRSCPQWLGKRPFDGLALLPLERR